MGYTILRYRDITAKNLTTPTKKNIGICPLFFLVGVVRFFAVISL
jgi:hypothetical protein